MIFCCLGLFTCLTGPVLELIGPILDISRACLDPVLSSTGPVWLASRSGLCLSLLRCSWLEAINAEIRKHTFFQNRIQLGLSKFQRGPRKQDQIPIKISRIRCPSVSVSQCHGFSVSWRPGVSMFQCLDVPVSQCLSVLRCFSASLCV